MLKKSIAPLLALLLLTPMIALAGPMGPSGPPPTVVLTKVTSADVIPAAEYVGHVEAIQSVDLIAQATGVVQDIHSKEGSFVQENDPILTIEQNIYLARLAASQAAVAQAEAAREGNQADLQVAQAGVKVAQASLEAANANFIRAKKYLDRMQSVNKKSITQADLDSAESDFLNTKAGVAEAEAIISQRQAQIVQTQARIKMDIANLQYSKAELQSTQINLDYTKIMAPISGRIGQIKTTRGNLVSPASGPIARIVQVDPIRVVYSVSENDLIELQRAIKLTSSDQNRLIAPHLKMPNGTTYPSKGHVSFHDNEIDPSTGTIAVRAEFPNPSGDLVPGQYVTVQVKTAASKIMATVPQVAVLMSKEGASVLMVDEKGLVTPRPITIGLAVGSMWSVTSGLQAGEEVIVSGLQKVRPGMPVTVAPVTAEGRK